MGRKPSKNLNLPPRMRARRRGDSIYYFYDTGSKPRKEIPLGKDYVLAVQEWAKLNSSPSPVQITVSYAIAQYLVSRDYSELTSGTQDDYRFALDKLLEHFGPAPLDDVTPMHLKQYHKLRCSDCEKWKGSKHRANREVSILGMIFRYARGEGWTTNDPKESVTLKKLPGRKNVYVDDDMFDAVYNAGGPVLQEACDIAYLLGQRPIDVLGLKEPKDGTIELRQTKTETPIRVAISGDLASVLDRIAARKKSLPLRIIDGPLLVDEKGLAMTKAKLRSRFEKARLEAGVTGKDYQFRDLRAKAATDLRDSVNIEASQALLGHSSVVMTEHYTRSRRGKIISAIPKKAASNGGSKS
jgi:integrase